MLHLYQSARNEAYEGEQADGFIICPRRLSELEESNTEKSDLHLQSTEKYEHLTMNVPITAALSEQLMKDKKSARETLSIIFSSIKYLAQHGFPLQGHEQHDGPLYNLVMERDADFPEETEIFMTDKKKHLAVGHHTK